VCSTDYLTDYGHMQQGIWAAGRPMVLSVEGDPPVQVITNGGYGNMKRVGHDIQATWKSMTSLVDIGSGLWPYAHNCTNVTNGGWWNDLGEGAQCVYVMSRSHSTAASRTAACVAQTCWRWATASSRAATRCRWRTSPCGA